MRRGADRGFGQGLHRPTLTALYLSQVRGTTYRGARLYQRAYACARQLESLLTYYEEDFEELAKEYLRSQDFLFLGRGIHYPVAL